MKARRWRIDRTRLTLAIAGSVFGTLAALAMLSLGNAQVVAVRATLAAQAWIRPLEVAKRGEIAARLFPPEVAAVLSTHEGTLAWLSDRNRRLAEAEAAIAGRRVARQHIFTLMPDGSLVSRVPH